MKRSVERVTEHKKERTYIIKQAKKKGEKKKEPVAKKSVCTIGENKRPHLPTASEGERKKKSSRSCWQTKKKKEKKKKKHTHNTHQRECEPHSCPSRMWRVVLGVQKQFEEN